MVGWEWDSTEVIMCFICVDRLTQCLFPLHWLSPDLILEATKSLGFPVSLTASSGHALPFPDYWTRNSNLSEGFWENFALYNEKDKYPRTIIFSASCHVWSCSNHVGTMKLRSKGSWYSWYAQLILSNHKSPVTLLYKKNELLSTASHIVCSCNQNHF